MRDFEDIDGDCNESQPGWDKSDDWELDDFDMDDFDEKENGKEVVEPDEFPF
jgi:hypothetical protein